MKKTIEEFINNNPFVRIENYHHNGKNWMLMRDGKYIVYSQNSNAGKWGDKILETDNLEAALEALEGDK